MGNQIPDGHEKMRRPGTASLSSLDGSLKRAFAFPSIPLAFLDLGAHQWVFQEVGA
jgi:hypothetical protein